MRSLELFTPLVKILFIGLLGLLSACGNEHKQAVKQPVLYQTMVVKPQPTHTVLYYDSTIAPLTIRNVTSPVDGTVKQQFFQYGEQLKKGEPLLVLYSSKLEEDFQDALTSYLKAKESYNDNIAKWQGTKELNRLGLVSRDDYRSQKSSLNDSSLSLVQAKRKLQDILKRADVHTIDIEKLTISDVKSINTKLLRKLSHVEMFAPSQGIALYPPKSSADSSSGDGDSDNSKQLAVGSPVKKGQILVAIGDLRGISLKINVNEVDIQNFKLGQKATVTGVAFPNITMHGKVVSINAQADAGGGGIPTFPVRIVVPSLSAKERSLIDVGMSAKLKIVISHKAQISIPIKAVIEDNGTNYVKVIDKKTGKPKRVPVQTGPTTMNDVVIQSGLKPGDKVVIPN